MMGCANQVSAKAQGSTAQSEDLHMQKYENEYFSIMHPKGWSVEWEEHVPFKGGNVDLSTPDGLLGMRLSISEGTGVNTDPRSWLEFWASEWEAKWAADFFEQVEDRRYVGVTEIIDSLRIDGHNTAKQTLVNKVGNNTVLVEQYFIAPNPNELCIAYIIFYKANTRLDLFVEKC